MTAVPSKTNLFLRNDTIFGTCQAIGEDFGFNPNWLRIPLAALVVVSPIGAVGGYLALSALVLASRSLFRSNSKTETVATVTAEAQPVEANDDQRELIAA